MRPTLGLELAAESTESPIWLVSRLAANQTIVQPRAKCRHAFARKFWGNSLEGGVGKIRQSWDDWEEEAVRERQRMHWLLRGMLGPYAPCSKPKSSRCPHRRFLRPRVFLPNAQYIDRGFPTGSAFAVRAAKSFVPERSNVPNQRQKYPKQAARCRRRGNAPRPCAQEKRNNGPYLTSVGTGSKGVNGTEGLPLRKYVENAENSATPDSPPQNAPCNP